MFCSSQSGATGHSVRWVLGASNVVVGAGAVIAVVVLEDKKLGGSL